MFDMLTSIFKNLGSKPATRTYPFEKREPFENSRGQISGVDIDSCIFCSICSRKCPANAIAVNKAEKSWEIDQFKCVICGVCTEVCPKKCILMESAHKTPAAVKDKQKHIQQPKTEEIEKSVS
ncbi:MAG: 4Fe-4S ferredoxin iron-sulfur binding domain protein [Clostridiales bacterium]|jgi:formate hydrogenlyase subunit 6/NADH:ubiquinone oxidoreductase subunit I|nr:4Fe-4S ferredoxin iron-sulfur binding domain protein [Clostridiales bacterium]